MVSWLSALLRATHLIPTLVVTALTFALAFRTSDFLTSAGIALTILSGQSIVGWSNDLIDHSDDLVHHRTAKPLVAGQITPHALRIALAIDSVALIILTIVGPLAGRYGGLHLVAVLSAFAYNVVLKSTPLSFLPWAISFGLLPIVVLGGTQSSWDSWVIGIGALFGIGLHFANVFKDLEEDLRSGIRGTPQILGVRYSKVVCAVAFGGGALLLYNQSGQLNSLLIAAVSLIYLLPIPTRFAFPFSMALGAAVMASFIGSI